LPYQEPVLNHSLKNTMQYLPLRQVPTFFLGMVVTGAERWQAAIRQIQQPKDLADILRARTFG
jgi:hypothetical protein